MVYIVCYVISVLVTPGSGEMSPADTFPLEKTRNGTRLDSTSPSANVFLTFCQRHLARAGLVTAYLYNYINRVKSSDHVALARAV